LNRLLHACLSLSLTLAIGQGGEPVSAGEYEVKAAWLLNLARFVEWPAEKLGDPSAPFIIGIVGADPFGGDLDKLAAGKTVAGRAVVIQRLSASQNIEKCHVLLVSRGERRTLQKESAALARASVLTVSDGDRSTASGSVVGFVMRDNRVQIEVNLAAAERHSLVVSSRLLRLVTVVKDGN